VYYVNLFFLKGKIKFAAEIQLPGNDILLLSTRQISGMDRFW
jgi:hypothetical protein